VKGDWAWEWRFPTLNGRGWESRCGDD
jgi:hypothetical protein